MGAWVHIVGVCEAQCGPAPSVTSNLCESGVREHQCWAEARRDIKSPGLDCPCWVGVHIHAMTDALSRSMPTMLATRLKSTSAASSVAPCR
jgi:hypothetical protein